jgi:N-acetylornithine carbamoyltransferase
MSDLVGLRAFAGLRDVAEDAADGTLHAAAAASSVPLLSLESAFDHPHQGLADALTVRRQFGGERVKVVITWAPHVRALPMAVPNAALVALAREGHDVVLCHPAGFDLAEAVVEHARGAARAAGGRVSVAHEREDALEGARVVYAKSWGASELYDDPEAGVAAVQAHPAWIVGAETMSATDNGIFMHCLPVRRGVVVADEVLDGDRSRVIPQAAARLDVQKATLCWALGVQP